MLTYPDIDPVAISLGPLKIHWYGLMYLIAFGSAWWLGTRRANRPYSPLTPAQVSDLIFYGALGVIIGGRLGYILFYDLANYIEHPLNILKVWQGGMAFHGGLIGVIVAMMLFARKIQQPFFAVTDFVAPLIGIGACAVRIGNFINGELWGRVSDVSWAMVFPTGGPLPRHPSQLYQAFMEGLLLFLILWWFTSKLRPRMAASGLFLITYGCFRFIAEFFRMPDAHIGYLAFDWFTQGQLLSTPMILAGAFMVFWAYRKAAAEPQKNQEEHR